MNRFDVIVIGGGHAGTEAAAAAARTGARTALITQRLDRIGAMSCNPSIGGVGKGHIVREVDAFEGIMPRAADAAAIHHRLLNSSKGSAVHGPRVQADRHLYREAVSGMLAAMPCLTLIEGEIERLSLDRARVAGVVLSDERVLRSSTVVLATGTFLGARLFRGREIMAGGRLGDAASIGLSAQMRELDPAGVARLKTGTPPRLDGRTVDWARLSPQPSDAGTWTMSAANARRQQPQIACAITRTTRETHDIVREGTRSSPLFSGAIEGRGPRYCPSIEDKILRFGDRDGHQIFLEPEGLDTSIIYPNGISTSLDAEIQQAFVASIPGLERARVVVAGYAVEYDYLDPRGLDRRLASRHLAGLFCAGQINGTTGYEEAAGQGLVAGLNAAAEALGRAPMLLDRASSYIGVMIDDLVLQGVSEPYRMLTARAEFRLSLRADNAESRLGDLAIDAGCLSPHRRRALEQRREWRAAIACALEDDTGTSDGSQGADGLLRHAPADLVEEMIATARYAPYVARQAAEVKRLRLDDGVALPSELCFAAVPGLSAEMIERLEASRPATLGEAGRIRGITPAALSAVLLHARRHAA